jgi:thiol-disulfide isomerase/thioredoxin
MLSIRGVFAVVVMAAVLSVPIYFYWGKLTKGMQPSSSTIILNRLELEGLPELTFHTLDGRPVSLSEFRGKILVLNIWATWCAPCVKEFPSLQRLAEKMGGQLVVLAVSQDKLRDDIEYFIKAFGKTPKDFVIAWDKDRVSAQALGTDVLPETYIVSPEGRLVRKVAGETSWDDPMALQFFKDILSPSEH